MNSPASRRRLGVNYSTTLRGVISRCPRVEYLKIPNESGAETEWPKAAELGLPLMLHNVYRDVRLGNRDLLEDFDFGRCRRIVRETRTPLVSFHLDADDPDAIPGDTVPLAVRNLKRLMEEVDRPVIVENKCYRMRKRVSPCLALPHNIRRVLDESGAGMLLDASHARVSAWGLGWDERDYFEALPLDRVREIHIASARLAPGKGLLDVHAPLEPEDYERLRWLLDATPAEYVTLEYGGRRDEKGRKDELYQRNDPEALVEQVHKLAETLG